MRWPQPTYRDGWYWTGDIARRDADGYVSVLEHERNLIISAARTSIRPKSRTFCSNILQCWRRRRSACRIRAGRKCRSLSWCFGLG